MNKIKKDWNNLKDKVTLDIKPPERCHGCDYTIEEMKEEFDVAWLEHRIPNTSFVFYVCPHCHTCSGNQHAAENAKKIRKQGAEESRIIKPKSNLILPRQN